MELDVEIRRFTWEDVERFTFVFNEINGLSGTEKELDIDFMRQFLSQPSSDPQQHCFLAEVDGMLVGFSLISPEVHISRSVSSGGVLKSYRNKGIERMLLKRSIEHARNLGVSILHMEASIEDVEAHDMFESKGFYRVRQYWQMRWEDDKVPQMSLPDGFGVRSFVLDQDEGTLVNLQNAAFSENWGFAPNTEEEIHARVRLGRGGPEGIIFVLDGDRPIAYNWTLQASNSHASVGWVAMTGVHPDYRGKGLGRTVVVAGMDYLKSKGVDGIELEVDAGNDAARELYLKLGFEKVGETVWFEKSLKV